MPKPEKALIAAIRRLTRGAAKSATAVAKGIGDDCAVLRVPPGHELLVTTDFSLEGTHFRREWHPARSVGHRCLARGLSDIAAMGGAPLAIFLSLALPAYLPQRWVDEFVRGLLDLAAHFKTPLAGGDTSTSPTGVLADIVVLGSLPKGKAILRSGARVGDGIYVTGRLGESVSALERLQRGEKLRPQAYPAHFFPSPQVDVGRYLRQHRMATSMIDTSDGLSTDLCHICEESGVGAVIWRDHIPGVAEYALHGGEDYQLLFTARPKTKVPAKLAGVSIARIGEIVHSSGAEMWIESSGKRKRLRPRGWEHFR